MDYESAMFVSYYFVRKALISVNGVIKRSFRETNRKVEVIIVRITLIVGTRPGTLSTG